MTGFGNQKFMNPRFTEKFETLSFQANSLVDTINNPSFNSQNQKMNEEFGVIVDRRTYKIKVIPQTKTKTLKKNEISNSKKKPTQETIIPEKQNFSANPSTVTTPSKKEKDKKKEVKQEEKKDDKKVEAKKEVAPAKTITAEKVVEQEQVSSSFVHKEKFKTGTFDFMLKYGMNPDKVHEIKNSKDSDIDLLKKYSVTEIAFAKVLRKDKEGNYFVNNAEIQNWAKMVDGKTIPKNYSKLGFSSFTPGTKKFLEDSGFNPTTIYVMLEAAEKKETLVGEYPTSALFLVGLMKKKGDTSYSIDAEGINTFKEKDKKHWEALSGQKPLKDTQVVAPEKKKEESLATKEENKEKKKPVEEKVATTKKQAREAEKPIETKKRKDEAETVNEKEEKQIEKNNDELTEEQKKRVEARKKADI
jgi:hypothetical protein